MAVHIRLRRLGKKKHPFYRIVATDSRRARDGRFLEILGTYNPISTPAAVTLKEDRLAKWLDEGARPSDTVSSLLSQIGFLEKYDKVKKGLDVSDVTLKTTIRERRKKTTKMKKAVVSAPEDTEVTEETADTVGVAEKAPDEGEEAPTEGSQADSPPD